MHRERPPETKVRRHSKESEHGCVINSKGATESQDVQVGHCTGDKVHICI